MRKETKAYIRYHARRSLKPFLFILTVAVIVTLLLCTSDRAVQYTYPKYAPDITNEKWVTEVEYSLKLEIPAIIATVVAFMQVSTQLAPFKKRRNLDMYFTLPMGRRALGLIHALTGLAITLITYTASFVLNLLLFIPAVVKYSPDFNFILLLPYYFISILIFSAIYFLLCFAFDRGNTKGDGQWLMALYTFAPTILAGAVIFILSKYFDINYYGEMNGCAAAFPTNLSNLTERFVMGKNVAGKEQIATLVWIIGWTLLGAASAFGFVYLFGKQPTQKTEELSDSPFAFKTLIPYYVILGAITFADVGFICFIIIAVLAVIGYVVYRRGFRLKRSDAITFAATLVLSLLLMMLLDK